MSDETQAAPADLVEPLTVVDGRMTEPLYVHFGDDEASYFSNMSPSKTASNEDCLLLVPLGDRQRVLVVADGVGGMPGGEHASRTTIELVQRHLVEGRAEGRRVRESLLDAIEAANEEICQSGSGSATTIAAVEIHGLQARCYHAGDSEILFHSASDGLLWKCLPHSPVGYRVEAGVLDPEEALFDNSRHLVSNVLGTEVLSLELNGLFELRAGETLLLASDGLFDNLRLEEILSMLEDDDLMRCTRNLIRTCQQRMAALDSTSPRTPSKADDLSLIAYRWAAQSTDAEATLDDREHRGIDAEATVRSPPELRKR